MASWQKLYNLVVLIMHRPIFSPFPDKPIMEEAPWLRKAAAANRQVMIVMMMMMMMIMMIMMTDRGVDLQSSGLP